MLFTPYDYECLVLGMTLRYPQAVAISLPELSYERFIYDKRGELGGLDHQRVWQAVMMVSQANRQETNLINVLSSMNPRDQENYGAYLRTLVEKVDQYYGVYGFEASSYAEFCTEVDKAGIVYAIGTTSAEVTAAVSTNESFTQYVNKIADVGTWAQGRIENFNLFSHTAAGYQHISTASEELLLDLDDIEAGKKSLLLPTGMTPLLTAGLLPVGKLVIVHGLMSAGKSLFTHTTDVGTAFGLVMSGMRGCVAINSLEMSPSALVARAAAMLSGFNTRKLNYGAEHLQGDDYRHFKEWIPLVGRLPLYIDATNLIETPALQYRSNYLHTGPSGPIWKLSVDYIELLGDKDNKDSKEQNLDAAIHNLFAVSRTLGATVTVISQSTVNNAHMIAGPMGTRYSRAIAHAADVIIEVYNPQYMRRAGISFTVPNGLDESHVWLLVQKFRDGEAGQYIPLGWEPEHTRLYDPEASYGKADKIIFTHLQELEETKAALNSYTVAPIDTTLGEF